MPKPEAYDQVAAQATAQLAAAIAGEHCILLVTADPQAEPPAALVASVVGPNQFIVDACMMLLERYYGIDFARLVETPGVKEAVARYTKTDASIGKKVAAAILARFPFRL